MTAQSTQDWFTDLLEKYKDDPDFRKEGIIFALQEQNETLVEAENKRLRNTIRRKYERP